MGTSGGQLEGGRELQRCLHLLRGVAHKYGGLWDRWDGSSTLAKANIQPHRCAKQGDPSLHALLSFLDNPYLRLSSSPSHLAHCACSVSSVSDLATPLHTSALTPAHTSTGDWSNRRVRGGVQAGLHAGAHCGAVPQEHCTGCTAGAVPRAGHIVPDLPVSMRQQGWWQHEG